MPKNELVISATEFKAKCLELLDAVSSQKYKRLVVTKRGKPIADLLPHMARAGKEPESWNPFAGLGVRAIVPPGFDLTAPVYDPKIDGAFEAAESPKKRRRA